MAACGCGLVDRRRAIWESWGEAVGVRVGVCLRSFALLHTVRAFHEIGSRVLLEPTWRTPGIAAHAVLGDATGA